MKTSELSGRVLAWAVGVAEGCKVETWHTGNVAILFPDAPRAVPWMPHEDWWQGGPIIDREHICSFFYSSDEDGNPCKPGWEAFIHADGIHCYGDTQLIATMRCYVASKLGDEIEIPEELK